MFFFPFFDSPLSSLLSFVPEINSYTPGYATASVEGRIAVEYFDPSPSSQEKKYAFKCHRQTINEVDHVWPVNSLAFHPTFNTFASAGSDGTVSIWDHKVKKRLRQYPKLPGPVAAVAFNCDGTKIAIGVSYTWDEGEKGLKTNAVAPWLGVRMVGEEVKVRFVSLFFFYYFFLPSFASFFLLRMANRESRHRSALIISLDGDNLSSFFHFYLAPDFIPFPLFFSL